MLHEDLQDEWIHPLHSMPFYNFSPKDYEEYAYLPLAFWDPAMKVQDTLHVVGSSTCPIVSICPGPRPQIQYSHPTDAIWILGKTHSYSCGIFIRWTLSRNPNRPKSEIPLEKFSIAGKKGIRTRLISSLAFLLLPRAAQNAKSKIHFSQVYQTAHNST